MKFRVSGNMLRFTDFRSEVEVPAPTIERGLEQLVEQLPQLKPVLLDGDGHLRAFHRLFLNGAPIARDELRRDVASGDEVTILTAIAGG